FISFPRSASSSPFRSVPMCLEAGSGHAAGDRADHCSAHRPTRRRRLGADATVFLDRGVALLVVPVLVCGRILCKGWFSQRFPLRFVCLRLVSVETRL